MLAVMSLLLLLLCVSPLCVCCLVVSGAPMNSYLKNRLVPNVRTVWECVRVWAHFSLFNTHGQEHEKCIFHKEHFKLLLYFWTATIKEKGFQLLAIFHDFLQFKKEEEEEWIEFFDAAIPSAYTTYTYRERESSIVCWFGVSSRSRIYCR